MRTRYEIRGIGVLFRPMAARRTRTKGAPPASGSAAGGQRPSRAHRAPGIARRKRLLDAARQLLRTRELDRLSLADIAAQAQIPKGSAYHYYDDVFALYAELLAVIDEELLADVRRPLRGVSIERWTDVIAELVRRAVRYYAAHPAARALILSTKVPPALKLRDRQNDLRIGGVFIEHIASRFVLPPHPRLAAVFFRAVEIADLMFSLSILEHGRITAEMAGEAAVAMVGYLSGHLPQTLKSRTRSSAPAAAP